MSTAVPDLRLARPRNVADAIAARRQHAGSRFIAGGTDLLVNVRHGISRPDLMIDLTGIDELAGIEIGAAGARIGAGVTLAALARDPSIAAHYRAVTQAAGAIAGPGHRVMGTVGGNLCLDTRCVYYNQSAWWRQANGFCLKHGGEVCHVAPQGQRCHAAFTGDLAPALLALAAEVEIAGADGRRRIPLGELYVEDGLAHLALGEDELVVAVHLPPNPPPSAYRKVRFRGAIDYPLAGVAVALRASGGVVNALRIGLTGTNSRPFVLAGTDAIAGRPLDDKALRDIDRLVQKQVQPMRTTLASAHYRRLAAAGL
ncbi:MAG TPA: 4-hydroxybenzoyl-CoA reductase subunit beta, partial [Xanthobacteraceae bacterium]